MVLAVLHPDAKWAGRLRTVDVDYLIARYEDGDSLTEIASDFGVRALTVGKHLKRNGYIERKTGRSSPLCKLSPTEMNDVSRRYSAGQSMHTLAAEFGISDVTLKSYLIRAGVVTRDFAEAKKLKWVHEKRVKGYVLVRLDPLDPYFSMAYDNSFVLKHRYVMAQHLGRLLLEGESVHHVDGNRAHNGIENLQLRQGSHGSGVVMRCNHCGSHDVSATPLREAA